MPPNTVRRSRLRLILCLTALTPVFAQPATAESPSIWLGTILLWSDPGELGFGTNATSATRTGETVKDLPAAVDVVDAETIATHGLHRQHPEGDHPDCRRRHRRGPAAIRHRLCAARVPGQLFGHAGL